MLDLEACALAGEMLRGVGFEHRYTSFVSEAAYYGWPGKFQVIRVACHKAHRTELNGVPVIATITFNEKNFLHGKIPKQKVIKQISEAIGKYLLVSSGVVRARTKFRQYWPGGENQIAELVQLEDED